MFLEVILHPLFFFKIYTEDQPSSNTVFQADFADDKVILTSNYDPNIISLDTHINEICARFKDWRIEKKKN